MDNAKDSYGFYYGATIAMLQSCFWNYKCNNFHIIDRFNVRHKHIRKPQHDDNICKLLLLIIYESFYNEGATI